MPTSSTTTSSSPPSSTTAITKYDPPPSSLQGQAGDGSEPTAGRRKRRRWGDAVVAATPNTTTATTTVPEATATMAGTAVVTQLPPPVPLRTAATTSTTGAGPPVATAAKNVLALQESIRARLAAAKAMLLQQQPAAATAAAPPIATSSITTSATAATAASIVAPSSTKRARHYELDLNDVMTSTKTISSSTAAGAKMAVSKSKQPHVSGADRTTVSVVPSNPYLAHLATTSAPVTLAHTKKNMNKKRAKMEVLSTSVATTETDNVTGQQQQRRPRRQLGGVEPGYWQTVAERKRQLAAAAEAAGFISGRKTGHTIRAAGILGTSSNASTAAAAATEDYYGGPTSAAAVVDNDDTAFRYHHLDQLPPCMEARIDGSSRLPLAVEWWDLPLLPPKLKKRLAAQEAVALQQQQHRQTVELFASATTAALTKEESSNANKGDQGGIVNETATGSNQELDAKEINKGHDEDDSSSLQQERTLVEECWDHAALSYSKTATLIQHIVPVKPAHLVAAATATKHAVLHLTKKELKRQRKLRRQEKQRQLQDLQAAGLIKAPEPRLTLQNFMQVMGDQAVLDPSAMELAVQRQIQARLQAHEQRNADAKLTAEQKRAKRARKLHEDTSTAVSVAVFYVRDMSHPYHRTKVERNAVQHRLTGCVLECASPSCAAVIVEGGPKAIQRFTRLMLVRMKWEGPDTDDDDGGDEDEVAIEDADDPDVPLKRHKFNPHNVCDLVWQGMAVRRAFAHFSFQAVEAASQARHICQAKNVAHYWDPVVQRQMSGITTISGPGGAKKYMQVKFALDDDDDGSSDDADDDSNSNGIESRMDLDDSDHLNEPS